MMKLEASIKSKKAKNARSLDDFVVEDTTAYGERDHLHIEIGDSKQEEFFPQVKFMAWNNESNFSVRAPSGSDVAFSEDSGTLRFDAFFDAKPPTNIMNFTVQSKEVDFHYQGELTAGEIANGDIRPDDVIGSYAVYTIKRGGRYKAGKLCHIYRPYVIDSLGVREWCDMNITGGILRITIPQAFIDSATYPVTLDPDFGYTTIGATSSYMNNQPDLASVDVGAIHAAVADDEVTSISIAGRATSLPATQQLSLYDMSGGVPVNRQVNPITIANSVATAWRSATGLSIFLTPGSTYTVAAGVLTGIGSNYIMSDSLTGIITSRQAGGLGDPWSQTATNSLQYSMYATYTAGTPPPPPPGGGGKVIIRNPIESPVINAVEDNLI